MNRCGAAALSLRDAEIMGRPDKPGDDDPGLG